MPSDLQQRIALLMRQERERQSARWSAEHDRQHEDYEWLGLIARYAARGEYVKAGALCMAAEEARRAALEGAPDATGAVDSG